MDNFLEERSAFPLSLTGCDESSWVELVRDQRVVERYSGPLQPGVGAEIAHELLLPIRAYRPLDGEQCPAFGLAQQQSEIDFPRLLSRGWFVETGNVVQVGASEHLAYFAGRETPDERGKDVLESFSDEVLSLVLKACVFVDAFSQSAKDVVRGKALEPRLERFPDHSLDLGVLTGFREALAFIWRSLCRGTLDPTLRESNDQVP